MTWEKLEPSENIKKYLMDGESGLEGKFKEVIGTAEKINEYLEAFETGMMKLPMTSPRHTKKLKKLHIIFLN